MMDIEQLKKQYEEDCKHSDTPWKWWEYNNDRHDYYNCTNHILWNTVTEYRRKPDAPVRTVEQWTPEGKQLTCGLEFVLIEYIHGQECPILVKVKCLNGDWIARNCKESDFEEIPAPYSHIKKGDVVIVRDREDQDYRLAIFSHVNDKGIVCAFRNGLLNGSLWSWNECLTIEEYNKLHGE